MGRHSAAADDEDEDAAVTVVLAGSAAVEAAGRGRHARPAPRTPGPVAPSLTKAPVAPSLTKVPLAPSLTKVPLELPVDSITAIAAVEFEAPIDAVAEPAASGSASDLALLRSDTSLLARCLAAVLMPFLVYLVVMTVIGSSGREWLIWIWLPAITAGVLAGAFLDSAHKNRQDETKRSSPLSGS